jgi:hypothetical protein
VIIATGLTQWITRRVSWAPAISKVRYAAAVISVAAALAVLDRGYLVGIAGLVSVMLSAPYIAIDRRDLLVMNVLPLAATAAIMWGAGLGPLRRRQRRDLHRARGRGEPASRAGVRGPPTGARSPSSSS